MDNDVDRNDDSGDGPQFEVSVLLFDTQGSRHDAEPGTLGDDARAALQAAGQHGIGQGTAVVATGSTLFGMSYVVLSADRNAFPPERPGAAPSGFGSGSGSGARRLVLRSLRPLRHRVREQSLANVRETLDRMLPDIIMEALLSVQPGTQQGLQGQPPASDAAISALQVLSDAMFSDKRRRKHIRCTICQEEFAVRSTPSTATPPLQTRRSRNAASPAIAQTAAPALETDVIRMPCHHIFHRECISTWLKTSCTCPTCRYEIMTDNTDYNRGIAERMLPRNMALLSEADTDLEDSLAEDGSQPTLPATASKSTRRDTTAQPAAGRTTRSKRRRLDEDADDSDQLHTASASVSADEHAGPRKKARRSVVAASAQLPQAPSLGQQATRGSTRAVSASVPSASASLGQPSDQQQQQPRRSARTRTSPE